MKRKIFCIPLLWLISARMHAQAVRSLIGAFYTETDTYGAATSNVFSTASNQAALASVQQFSAGVYGEKRFLLQDLGFYKAVVALPSGMGNFGLNMDYSGGTAFYSCRLGMGYGRKLGDKMDAGIQFNYHTIKAAGYEQVSSVTVEGGMLFQLNPRLHSGFHAFNPLGARIGKDRLPSIYTAGLGYDASKTLSVNAVVQKTEDQPVDFITGLQYRFNERLFARAGLNTTASMFLLGTGIVVNDLRIDVSASIHPSLGITPGLTLIYHPVVKS